MDLNEDDFALLPDTGPTFKAQFESDCGNCEFTLQAGQDAKFEGNSAVHLECPSARPVCTDCWLVHGTAQESCDG